VYGVHAEIEDTDEQLNAALEDAKKNGFVDSGAKVVTITAANEDTSEETNIMKIMTVE